MGLVQVEVEVCFALDSEMVAWNRGDCPNRKKKENWENLKLPVRFNSQVHVHLFSCLAENEIVFGRGVILCLLFPYLFFMRLPSLFAFMLAPRATTEKYSIRSTSPPIHTFSLDFLQHTQGPRQCKMEESDPSRIKVCCHPAHQIPDPPLTDSGGLDAFSRASQCRRDPPTQTESSSRKPSRHPVGHKRGLPRNTIQVAEM